LPSPFVGRTLKSGTKYGLLLTADFERIYSVFQDAVTVSLALLVCLGLKNPILYPSSDGNRFDPQLACNLWDRQKRCCIFVHINMNQGTRTIFPNSARKITARLWQLQQRLQQPPQTTTKIDKHQQTKHGLVEREKDDEGQPRTSRAISGPWHFSSFGTQDPYPLSLTRSDRALRVSERDGLLWAIRCGKQRAHWRQPGSRPGSQWE
jgi:hypothetical protein